MSKITASANSKMKNKVISLFDYSGVFVKPWLDDGYECWIVDKQHKPNYSNCGITREGNLFKVNFDLRKPWLLPFDRSEVALCVRISAVRSSGCKWVKVVTWQGVEIIGGEYRNVCHCCGDV